VQAIDPVSCRHCQTQYCIFLDPDDHEPERALPFRPAHIEAIKYFKEEITSEHGNGHRTPRFIMSGNTVTSRVRVVGDPESIAVAYDDHIYEVLDGFEARLLADRLMEFSEIKTGGTDIELRRFRRLTVQGSRAGVSFCFFGPDADRRQDWVVLSHGDAVATAVKLQQLCVIKSMP
jgi:hypothetical protein